MWRVSRSRRSGQQEGQRDSAKRTGRRRAHWLAAGAAPVAAALLAAAPAIGQTVTWDANPTSPATPNDGSGSWSTTAANWSDGVSDSPWVNGNTANIGNGGTAGTIVIDAGPVTASGINFNAVASGNYTVGGAGLNLTGPASINVAAGLSPTISAPITGTAGLSVNGLGTLNLTGNNTFTDTAAVNSGAVIVGTGGTLGASGNLLSLGTPNNGTATGDPTGAVTISPGVSTTVGSFKSATNNTTAANTLTIGSGGALNVTSSSALTGLNASVNGGFVVGTPNALGAMATSLTVSGAGALNVNGGTNNASLYAGVGNCNTSSFAGTVTLDMSGLANFNFTTGTGAIPATGGNEFAVAHGAGSSATVSLAATSSVTAGTISVGDGTLTPGLTGSGPNAPAGVSVLNLGSTSTTLNANTFLLGNGRSRGTIQWSGTTGTLTLAGAAGGASTADITIGRFSTGTAPNTPSALDLSGHDVTVQAGTVNLGVLDGGSGSGTRKGGTINFDTGTFNVADLKMAVGLSGAATGNLNGTFNLGNNASSTGVLNVTHSFWIGDVTGGAAKAQGNLNIAGGTANINADIIDVSTAVSSNSTLQMTGGTLNMMGHAIGTTAAGTGGLRPIANILLPALGNSAVLANLGGDGINGAGLTMTGTGTLVLEGNNTYTGGTTINAGGTIQIGQASDTAAPTSAIQSAVTDNGTLAFGSSQPMSVSTVISGTGGVRQVGTGTTTLTGSSSYTGGTTLVGGTLSVASLPDAGAGGVNSPLGAASNAASNLVLSGGTFQYAGPAASTDRLFSIAATGGSIDASGSGPINFNNGGATVSADPAPRATTDSTSSTKVTLANVSDLVVGMTVSSSIGSFPAGTTITAINPQTNSITLSNTPTVAGADTLSFGTAPRTLTLTGTNTGSNTLGNPLSDSTGGGVLSVAKTGPGTWVLSTPNTYSGSTSVSAGTLILSQSQTTTSSVSATGGSLVLANSGTHDHVLKTAAATTSGTGRIDLQDNKLIVTTAGQTGAWNGTAYDGITGQVASGRNGGDWAGSGIVTSLAANNADYTSLGVANATDVKGLTGTATDTFAGQTVHAGDTLVMYTYGGDANLDGVVNIDDYTQIDSSVSVGGVLKGWFNGDFNYDGDVNIDDYTIIDSNIGIQGAPFPTAAGISHSSGTLSGVTAVPEPASLGMLALAGASLLGGRRRRRS